MEQVNDFMWIDKEIIPVLIEAVETVVKEELEAEEQPDYNPAEHYDPNDIIIFHGFVLPVLKENLQYGFFAGEMLHKGFDFMVGLIPWIINKKGDSLSATCLGKLLRLHYQFWLKTALVYVQDIEAQNLEGNLERINQYIDTAKLDMKPKAAPTTPR